MGVGGGREREEDRARRKIPRSRAGGRNGIYEQMHRNFNEIIDRSRAYGAQSTRTG